MNDIQNIFEEKVYDENSSKEEIEAIKNGIFVYEPGVIYYQDTPIQSPFSINIQINQAMELGKQFDKWGVIIDLRYSKRPDAKTRRALIQKFEEMASLTSHTSFYTKGILLHTAIRFVMFGLDSKSYSVNTNFNSALKDVKESLNV